MSFIDGIFLEVLVNGKETKIRKQRLCFLAQKSVLKISNDVSKRYIPQRTIVTKDIISDSSTPLWKSEFIARGEFVILKDNNNLFFGVALNFQKSNEKFKKQKRFLQDFINLKTNKNVSLLLDPSYVLEKNYSKKEVTETHKYLSQNCYVCHILNDSIDLKNQHLKKILTKFIKEMGNL